MDILSASNALIVGRFGELDIFLLRELKKLEERGRPGPLFFLCESGPLAHLSRMVEGVSSLSDELNHICLIEPDPPSSECAIIEDGLRDLGARRRVPVAVLRVDPEFAFKENKAAPKVARAAVALANCRATGVLNIRHPAPPADLTPPSVLVTAHGVG